MDVLKRNVFWLVLAAVLVTALVAYLTVVVPVRSEAGDLSTNIEEFETQFKKWAKDSETFVFSDTKISKTVAYKSRLKSEKDKVRSECEAAQFDLKKAGFNPEPPQDSVDFRVWLQGQYAERDKMLKEHNIARFGRVAAEWGDYPVEIEKVPPRDRDIALRRLYITREVYKAIAACVFTEKVLVRGEENPNEELPKEVKRHVDAIGGLVFMMPGTMAGARGSRSVGGKTIGMAEAPEMTPGRPYREHLFELNVVCHYSLVPQLIQNLDGIRDFMLVIKRVDVLPTRATKVESGAAERSATMLRNTRDSEAPVTVLLECAVLQFEFDEAAAKGGEQ